MNVATKFLVLKFFNSLIFTSTIVLCLIFILNLTSELDFFKDIKENSYLPIYFSLLNAPSMVFEMFPFIFLLSTQLFFLNIFKENQIDIFKYSGFKNDKIIKIISIFSIILGIVIIVFFYSISSNLKKLYLNLKSNYTDDDKYLAVITKNGLWIKDLVDEKILIINSSKIEHNIITEVFISEFDKDYNIIRNIKSPRVNIEKNNWKIYQASIFQKNNKEEKDILEIYSNFNYKRIQSLFSNLSSLSINELFGLRKNYELLRYSTIEVDIQIIKILTYPIYLLLMVNLASIIMLNFKSVQSNTFKISLGIFVSVIIFYFNNFFIILGKIEKIPYFISIIAPIIILFSIILLMLRNINEK